MGLRSRIKNLVLHAMLRRALATRLPGQPHALALTFDDGPNPVHTPRILDMLREHGACATFFLVGSAAERHPEIVQRMVREGHELGNHSYQHVRFAGLSAAQQWEEIVQTNSILARHDGHELRWFRPPQGRMPLKLLLLLRRHRQRVALWSYDSLDYRGDGVDAIVRRFEAKPAGDGDVVLMHDDNEQTVGALERLLVVWKAQGYRFVRLSETGCNGSA